MQVYDWWPSNNALGVISLLSCIFYLLLYFIFIFFTFFK